MLNKELTKQSWKVSHMKHKIILSCKSTLTSVIHPMLQFLLSAFCFVGISGHAVGLKLREQLNTSAIVEALEQLKQCPVGLDSILKRTVAFGVAFHHAGILYICFFSYYFNKKKFIESKENMDFLLTKKFPTFSAALTVVFLLCYSCIWRKESYFINWAHQMRFLVLYLLHYPHGYITQSFHKLGNIKSSQYFYAYMIVSRWIFMKILFLDSYFNPRSAQLF